MYEDNLLENILNILKSYKRKIHYRRLIELMLKKGFITENNVSITNKIIYRLKNNSGDSEYKEIRNEGKGYYKYNFQYMKSYKNLFSDTLKKKRRKRGTVVFPYYKKYTKDTALIGKAGEYHVCSELLFRGYNATIMSVDTGIDILAIKEDRLIGIQVKTANVNKFDEYNFDIRRSSFERHNKESTYYVFVLKGEIYETCIILPSYKIIEMINEGLINKLKNDSIYRLRISFRSDDLAFRRDSAYIGKTEVRLRDYINNWELIN